MKVRRLIEELQKMPQDAEVKMHDRDGDNLLFVMRIDSTYHPEYANTVYLEDKTDNDLSVELDARFEDAMEYFDDELDFFMDLLDVGFTLEDIKENLPEKYEYSKTFMEEHGLI